MRHELPIDTDITIPMKFKEQDKVTPLDLSAVTNLIVSFYRVDDGKLIAAARLNSPVGDELAIDTAGQETGEATIDWPASATTNLPIGSNVDMQMTVINGDKKTTAPPAPAFKLISNKNTKLYAT